MAATALIQQPQPFTPGSDPATAWEDWREEYELYEEVCKDSIKSEDARRALLLHVLGKEARRTYKGFTFASSAEGQTRESAKQILDKFTELYNAYRNPTQAMFVFEGMTQKPGQTIDEFVSAIRLQANNCDFGQKYDRMVGDRLIFGINDSALRERLFRESPMELEQIIKTCRASEISKKHAKLIESTLSASNGGRDDSDASVDMINRRHWRSGRSHSNNVNNRDQRDKMLQQQQRSNPGNPRQFVPNKQRQTCFRCGTTHAPRSCLAYGSNCFSCGKFGHFAQFCQQKQLQQNVATLDQDTESDPDTVFLGELTVNTIKNHTDTKWFHKIIANGQSLNCKLDTGSEVNVISREELLKWPVSPIVYRITTKVSTYSGEKLPVLGKCILNCIVDNSIFDLEFIVVDLKAVPILGVGACEKLKLVQRIQLIGVEKMNTNKGDGGRKCESIKPGQAVPIHNETPQSIIDEFPDVFEGIGRLPGQYTITLKPDSVPCISAPRKVPSALEAKVKAELQRMMDNCIIAKVTEPSDWVHPIVIAMKKDNGVRICLDPRILNKAIKRQHYKIPTHDELFAKLHGSKYFTLLDASDAFWQLVLDDSSSSLCTFATPWGRYRFLRLPFGLCNAPELFQQAMDKLFENEPDIDPYFDDILLPAADMTQHCRQIRRALTIARNNNLKLKRNKMKVCLKQITYLGHVISEDGIAVDPEKVRAITSLNPPTNRTELMRLLGMATYLMKFIPNFSEETYQLRTLLKSNVPWVWDANMDRRFNKLKQILSTTPVLRFFDKMKPLVISTDASSYGLGSVLLQGGSPLAYASAALTTTQQAYAQIEKELLAVVFACEHFHYYIFGANVIVHTDHKPLIGLQHKSYEKLSPRLQRLLLRLQRYNIELTYVPGKYLAVADTLSRAPDTTFTVTTSDFDGVVSLCLLVTATTPKFEQLRQATLQDRTLQIVAEYINTGWPELKHKTKPEARPFYHCRSELHITEDLVCRGQRLVLPELCRRDALNKLHIAHRGIAACKNKARQSLYWPTLNRDIEELLKNCQTCQQYQRNNQLEPLEDRQLPTRPWQRLGLDFFHLRSVTYLLVIDYFSKYVEMQPMGKTTATATINSLKTIFARFGIPEELICDNGPPLDSLEFRTFLNEWDINYNPSSPLYPRSNGQVERSIQTIKSSLTKAAEDGQDLYAVLMDYRNTPTDGLETPAEILMGRKIRTLVPILPGQLKPKFSTVETQRQLKLRQQKQHTHGDIGKKLLKQLTLGQQVWFRLNNKWCPASIIQIGPQKRSYLVQAQNGIKYRRNRYHLRPAPGREANQPREDNPRSTFMSRTTVEDYYPELHRTRTPEGTNEKEIIVPVGPVVNPACNSSTTKPVTGQITTRSGRTVNRPARYDEG